MDRVKSVSSAKMDLFWASVESNLPLQFVEGGIAAGFPSPADDFLGNTIDLNTYLIKNKVATFYARVKGSSLLKIGIADNDLLIIDRSIEYGDGMIAVCYLDGEFTAKKIKIENGRCWLMPENDDFKPIEVFEENQLVIWGVVTYAIKSLLCTH